VNTSVIDSTSNTINNNTNLNQNVNTTNYTGLIRNTNYSNSSSTNNNTNINTNNNTSVSSATNINQNTSNSNSVSLSTSDTTINQTSNSTSEVTSNNNNVNTNNSNSTSNSTSDSTQRITQDINSPPPSAIAPSIGSSYSQDLCTTGISGAVQTQILGFSTGKSVRDKNCERIKLSKTLYDMGMRVAAVSLMCQDYRVWSSMMDAGTPCPIEGQIGDEAKALWATYPERIPSPERRM